MSVCPLLTLTNRQGTLCSFFVFFFFPPLSPSEEHSEAGHPWGPVQAFLITERFCASEHRNSHAIGGAGRGVTLEGVHNLLHPVCF